MNENSEFLAQLQEENISVEVPVGGIHFVYNALCAVTVGRILNISNENIKKGIKKFELTKKRMDISYLNSGAILINDSYNASYESMKMSIEYLSNYEGKRKIAVLGDMFELGEHAKELHEKVGEEVAKNNIDILICSGENSKYIIKKAKEMNNKIKTFYFEKKDEITEKIKKETRQGDIILIKASNGMKFYEISSKL